MSKTKTIYVCQECGYESPKWLGKCPECGHWNTMIEEITSKELEIHKMRKSFQDIPKSLTDIDVTEERRITSEIEEFDRILGQGLVRNSVVLVGGEPGIGKSTLLLQVSSRYCTKNTKILYVSAEESIKQTKIRANRLEVNFKNLFVVNQTNLDVILEYINRLSPDIVIIDSIQTIYRPELNSTAGSISQVRECAAELSYLAKVRNFTLFLVGHVTKEGAIAGPKVLEHIVDTVLYFEGDRHHNYRILRAVKNRFGSTNEVGIFEMTDRGLKEVKNPSDIFLSERPEDTSGSVVAATLEGSRPILVEIQALVSFSGYPQPSRRTTGVDYNKVNLLIAVLEKRLKFKLFNKDIFVNVAGGVKLQEPATDLAVVCAISSSSKDIPIERDVVVFGEVGLGGEVRAVTHPKKRIEEAERLGFKKCVMPSGNSKGLSLRQDTGIKLIPVNTIYSALKEVLKPTGK
ncbi:MAG TPA: DNA repair protein RadA [Candidatus Omnitrophica bacterium]|nr:DNA repair protein RadA [Candidatus Omnitrophota bacterium]